MLNNYSQSFINSIGTTKTVDKSNMFRLDLAEGLFAVPNMLTDKLSNRDSKEISSLPDRSSSELKKSIAKYTNIEPDNISVFSGSDEIIEIIPRIYLNQLDTSLCVVPTFSRMISSPKKTGAKVEVFRLEKSNGYKLDEHVFEKFITEIKTIKPKVVWICTPNNPTGITVELGKIKQIVSTFPEIMFVINEVYQEYNSIKSEDSAVSLVKNNNNLLVIRSFSKAFGLAGMRIGYVIGGSARINEIEKLRTMYNISSISSLLALEALNDIQYVEDMIEVVKYERERVIHKISSELHNLEFIPGSVSNLLLLKHKSKDLFQELYNKNALASDWRASLGLEGEGYVRISIGQKEHNDRIISLLKGVN